MHDDHPHMYICAGARVFRAAAAVACMRKPFSCSCSKQTPPKAAAQAMASTPPPLLSPPFPPCLRQGAWRRHPRACRERRGAAHGGRHPRRVHRRGAAWQARGRCAWRGAPGRGAPGRGGGGGLQRGRPGRGARWGGARAHVAGAPAPTEFAGASAGNDAPATARSDPQGFKRAAPCSSNPSLLDTPPTPPACLPCRRGVAPAACGGLVWLRWLQLAAQQVHGRER
jgi:hypothetical protein